MTKLDFCEVMGNIRQDYVVAAHIPTGRKGTAWLKWGALAACLCLVIAAATIFLSGTATQETAQSLSYNGFEYWICGAEGERSILKECGLPEALTADLAGEPVGYLKRTGETSYEVTSTETEIPLFEYAPQPSENIYILEIDGIYYAAIRRDNGNYKGLAE